MWRNVSSLGRAELREAELTRRKDIAQIGDRGGTQ